MNGLRITPIVRMNADFRSLPTNCRSDQLSTSIVPNLIRDNQSGQQYTESKSLRGAKVLIDCRLLW
jgi:hypothetical protein